MKEITFTLVFNLLEDEVAGYVEDFNQWLGDEKLESMKTTERQLFRMGDMRCTSSSCGKFVIDREVISGELNKVGHTSL
jgi:hypothetical protein